MAAPLNIAMDIVGTDGSGVNRQLPHAAGGPGSKREVRGAEKDDGRLAFLLRVGVERDNCGRSDRDLVDALLLCPRAVLGEGIPGQLAVEGIDLIEAVRGDQPDHLVANDAGRLGALGARVEIGGQVAGGDGVGIGKGRESVAERTIDLLLNLTLERASLTSYEKILWLQLPNLSPDPLVDLIADDGRSSDQQQEGERHGEENLAPAGASAYRRRARFEGSWKGRRGTPPGSTPSSGGTEGRARLIAGGGGGGRLVPFRRGLGREGGPALPAEAAWTVEQNPTMGTEGISHGVSPFAWACARIRQVIDHGVTKAFQCTVPLAKSSRSILLATGPSFH